MPKVINDAMEDQVKLIESLLEKAAEYGKTSFELVKLKAIDKTSEVVSTLIPHAIVVALMASFLLFLNLGLALWLGEILGKTCFGFFVVAAFYGISAIVLHFMMHKRLKMLIWNYIIKQVLK